MRPDSRGKLLKALRRKVRGPYRTLLAELLDADRALFRFTCDPRQRGGCGNVWEEVLRSKVTKQPLSRAECEFYLRLWTKAYGACTGSCPRCTGRKKDDLYPVTKSVRS